MILQHSRKENGKSMLTLEEPGALGRGLTSLLSLQLISCWNPLQPVDTGSPEARDSISVADAGQPSSAENRAVSGGMDLKGQPNFTVSHT